MSHITVEIAKRSIEQEFNKDIAINKAELIKEYPFLSDQKATFVTINKRNSLRGCIGSLIAHQSLIDDIIQNAKSAAFGDFRFKPLRKDELQECKIEVSILTEPKKLHYESIDDLKSKIRVGIDGVVLTSSGKKATFLPSVWEQLPTFELFFSHLCQKAMLNSNCLNLHPQISIYQVEKYI